MNDFSKTDGNFLAEMVKMQNNPLLKKHGISFHWWNSEPTSLHCHDFYEIFILTRGAAAHEWNGKTYELTKNTLHLLRPEDCHRIIPKSGDCMHMNLCLSPERFRLICRCLGLSENAFAKDRPVRVSLSADETDLFIRRAESVNLLLHSGEADCQPLMSEMAVQAVASLYRLQCLARDSTPPWFTRLLEQLHSPENLNADCRRVYELANFSAPVLIEAFKKYTGKTVSGYLRDIKMKYARESLQNTDIPLPELSNQLGYASLSHFSRIFKEYTGQSPAAYRRQR